MKIQYASDLHLEFKSNSKFLEENPLSVAGEILLLAGDISYLDDKKLNKHIFWDWAADNFKQTFIVPGNHEYYGGFDLAETMENFKYSIRSNVTYLNNRSIIINEMAFHFSTLWSIISPAKKVDVQFGMMDCHQIKYKGRPFHADTYEEVHHTCMSYLRNAISENKDKKHIVITHNVPTELCNAEIYRNSPLTSAFVVELSEFIKANPINYWIYGHSHANMPKTILGKTTLLTNQLGYVQYNEHTDFVFNTYVKV